MEASPTTGFSVPGAGPGKEADLQAESTAEQYASQAVQFAWPTAARATIL